MNVQSHELTETNVGYESHYKAHIGPNVFSFTLYAYQNTITFEQHKGVAGHALAVHGLHMQKCITYFAGLYQYNYLLDNSPDLC